MGFMKRAESVRIADVKIRDSFWGSYISLVRKVILPYQWDILNDQAEGAEPSGCIRNFRIAAGEEEGSFCGAVFQDTDVAKWLEAVAYSLAAYPDENLEQLADETIELIGRAQQPDGYLNTYFTIEEPERRFRNLTEGHELYTAGHMIEAAVAYYEATGKDKFLTIMKKNADLICTYFGEREDQSHGYPGHQEIELALTKLYRVTGNRTYLETAKYFIEARGQGENYFLKEMNEPDYKHIFPEFKEYDTKYSQSDKPVREQNTAEGHSVRAMYMYCAMADLAYEYEDEALLEVCERLWKNITTKRMFLTGGIGSSGILERFTTDYDLPNDANYAETCASIGLALFGRRMAQIRRDASYIDVVEKALYNTVLSGIARDGKRFFYVNPLEVWPDNCLPRTSMEHVKPVRQRWFSVACCPPNIARTFASLGEYAYFQEGSQIYVNLFIGSELSIRTEQGAFRIIQETQFPYEGKITFRVDGEQPGSTGTDLNIRIPSYIEGYEIYRGSVQVTDQNIENGYFRIRGLEAGDRVEVTFEMPIVYMRANPKVRADAGKVALMKGPLVYCLEECDNGENLAAVYVDTDKEPEFRLEQTESGEVPIITGTGKRISQDGWDEQTLYQGRKPVAEDICFKAVPYCYWCNREAGEMLVWMKELLG